MNYIKNEEMTYLDILFAPSFQCGVNGTSLELLTSYASMFNVL